MRWWTRSGSGCRSCARQRHELAGQPCKSCAPTPDRHEEFLAGCPGDPHLQQADVTDAAGQILAGSQLGRGAEADALRRDVGGDGVEIPAPLAPAQGRQDDVMPLAIHAFHRHARYMVVLWDGLTCRDIQTLLKIDLIPHHIRTNSCLHNHQASPC
jgi:hypothetical protein